MAGKRLRFVGRKPAVGKGAQAWIGINREPFSKLLEGRVSRVSEFGRPMKMGTCGTLPSNGGGFGRASREWNKWLEFF